MTTGQSTQGGMNSRAIAATRGPDRSAGEAFTVARAINSRSTTMVDSAEWGRGFASEAGRMAVDWAFTTLDLDEVISVTLPHNTASRRVMAKVGLTDTGTTVTLRGHEQVLYRITRTEWERTTRTDWESNASTS